MRSLVDTDIVIDALTRARNAADLLDRLSDDGLAISIVSVGELYDGTHRSADSTAAAADIHDFLAGYTVLNLSDPIVWEFGRLRALLRHQGRLIPDLDLLIAATALVHDLTLVTRNRRRFARIPALRLYGPGAGG